MAKQRKERTPRQKAQSEVWGGIVWILVGLGFVAMGAFWGLPPIRPEPIGAVRGPWCPTETGRRGARST